MKVAIIGSRNLSIENLEPYLPEDTEEIVSEGARGIDMSARDYAISHHLRLTEFLPQYKRYGRAAPLKRNVQILEYADFVIAFWDGASRGTKFVIDQCRKLGRAHKVYITKNGI